MFLLQRDGKAVDDRTENLEQFADAVVTFRLVHKPVKDVGNGATDKGPVPHELCRRCDAKSS